MSYDSVEISAYGGKPTEFFKFTIGASTYRYCGGTRTTTLSTGDPAIDGTYTAHPISLGELEHTRDAKSLEVGITVPRDNPVAAEFIGTLPDGKVLFDVFRKHDSDAQVISWCGGTVLSCDFRESIATMTCRPVMANIAKMGLSWRYQTQCNLQTYSARCGVDVADFTEPVTVTVVDDLLITVSGIPATDSNGFTISDGYYNGGYIQTSDGTKRFITLHEGNDLSLLIPFRSTSIAVTDTVDLIAGDDHIHTTCRLKFLNIGNFMGFFSSPTRNPFTQGGLTKTGQIEA